MHLPVSDPDRVQHTAYIRNGDIIEFRDQEIFMTVSFVAGVSNPLDDARVEVASSRPLDRKEQLDSDEQTDDESLDGLAPKARNTSRYEAQGTHAVYTTDGERQSDPQPGSMVEETPSKTRGRLRQEVSMISVIPDSMQLSPLINRFDSRREVEDEDAPKPSVPPFSLKSSLGKDKDVSPAGEGQAAPIVNPNEVPLIDTNGTNTDDADASFGEDENHETPTSSANMVAEGIQHQPEELQATIPSSQPEGDNALSGEGVEMDDVDPSDNETLETPEPQSRSTKKRKLVVYQSASRTKRARGASEEERVAEDTPANFKSRNKTRTQGKDEARASDFTPANTKTRGAKHIKKGEEEQALEEKTIETATRRTRSSPKVLIEQRETPQSHPDGAEVGGDYPGKPPRILFPTEGKILKRKGLMGFLKEQKTKQAQEAKPKSFDMLCVDNGELKTTAKLLTSLLHGKVIVTEDWVVQSSKAHRLVDPGPFLPEALQGTMHKDRTKVFSDMTIYFTPRLKEVYHSGWDDIRAFTEQAGAKVLSCAPSSLPKSAKIDLYLGSEKDDKHAVKLQEQGVRLFRKDIIANSIVAGELILDEKQFGLEAVSTAPASSSGSGKAKGRKGRK